MKAVVRLAWPSEGELLNPISPIIGISSLRDELQIRNHLSEADIALVSEH